MKNKIIPVALALSLAVPTLAACSKGKDKEQEGERTLRIASSMYFGGDDNGWFRQQFTEIFEYANPNIKLEFVPTTNSQYMYAPPKPGEKMPDPMEKLKEAMQGANPPDVVMFNLNQTQDLLADNLLTPLDPLIAKDKFDTSGIVPAVLDGLKSSSPDGKLYALAPTFSSGALIYNKKLFDDAGVPYPTDNMTWDQVFDLARRVSKGEGDNRVYGFNFYSQGFADLFNSSYMYTAPLNLRTFDEKGEKMTVDSDQWEKVWNTLIQLDKDKVVPSMPNPNDQKARMMGPNGNENPFQYDDFMSGRLAMTLMNFGELSRIDNANQNAENIKGYTKIDYDAVTAPSHPEAPGVVANIGMNGIMGINAKAANAADAWKFIKFINSDDWARAKANNNYQLVSRKKYIKAKEGSNLHIEAFYNIKPVVNNPMDNYKLYQEKPNIFRVQDIGRNYFQQAQQGQKSVRDALKAWQTEGDALLQQMKDNPNAGMEPPKPLE